jgi:hypothetical protein
MHCDGELEAFNISLKQGSKLSTNNTHCCKYKSNGNPPLLKTPPRSTQRNSTTVDTLPLQNRGHQIGIFSRKGKYSNHTTQQHKHILPFIKSNNPEHHQNKNRRRLQKEK